MGISSGIKHATTILFIFTSFYSLIVNIILCLILTCLTDLTKCKLYLQYYILGVVDKGFTLTWCLYRFSSSFLKFLVLCKGKLMCDILYCCNMIRYHFCFHFIPSLTLSSLLSTGFVDYEAHLHVICFLSNIIFYTLLRVLSSYLS